VFIIGCALQLSAAETKLPSNFFSKKLPNGLEVLVIEDASVPLATIEICVRNGSYTEPRNCGLCRAYVFKANKDYPSEQFLARVKNWVLSLGQRRMKGQLLCHFRKLYLNLEWSLLTQLLLSLFSKEEMKKENVVVDGEFQRNESNPVSSYSGA
jgi:zinc protease